MNAYSYKRWSSARQGEPGKDSFLRQTDIARSVCKAKGWNLVDLPPEDGISAFKGKNLSHKGILGQFIKRVSQGLVPVPCVLVIERLDRFSRREVDEVLPLFLDLLKRGVEVYSALENDHYTIDKIKDDPITNLLKILMGFVGANQYSKAIGSRVKAAKQRKREAALSGKQVWMFDCCPQCFDFDAKRERYVKNEKAKIVKLIFDLYQNEESILAVTKILNKRGIKPLQTAELWSAEVVRRILVSPYTMGEFKGLKNYFPKIVDESVFKKVQGMIHSRARGKGKAAHLFNFLRGFIYCAECGQKAVQVSNKLSVRYFGCKGTKRHTCKQKHLQRSEVLEEGLFAFVLQTSPDDLLRDADKLTIQAANALEAELQQISKDIKRHMNVADIGIEELRTELERLKKLQDAKAKELDILKSRIQSPNLIRYSRSELGRLLRGKNQYALNDALAEVSDKLKNNQYRQQIREPLSTILDKIVCDFDKGEFHVELKTGVTSETFYAGD